MSADIDTGTSVYIATEGVLLMIILSPVNLYLILHLLKFSFGTSGPVEFLEKCVDPKRQGEPSFAPVGVKVGACCLSCAAVSKREPGPQRVP